MKASKFIIVLILIVVVFILWYFNLMFLSRIKTRNVEMKPIKRPAFFSPESIKTAEFKFMPLKTDPFNVTVDTAPKEPGMPRLSLRGIVIARDGALALMELPDRNVYPMKKGQKYLGVQILKITPKEVTVRFRGEKETFTVLE